MKVRTEQRARTVPKTIDGKTHEIDERYTVEVPVPPPDRDAQVLAAVLVLTVLVVAGAITWSTLAIGSLLTVIAPTWVAFLVAAIFDLAWITAMALEWLARYDPVRARLPRRMGWMALGISMGLIAAHGAQEGALLVGFCGALVSAVAKGMWHLVMRSTAVEMDPATQAWMDAERRDVGAQLATTAARRQLSRTRARIQEEESALGSGSRVTELEWKTPATDGLTADRLEAAGQDTAERIRRTEQSAGSGPVRIDPGSGSGGSVKDVVRTLYTSGTTDPADVVRAVQAERPEASAETIKRHVRTVRTEGGYA